MNRVVRYSLLAALALVTVCTAAPSPTYRYSGGADLASSDPSSFGADVDGFDLSSTTDSVIPTVSSQVIPQQEVDLGSQTNILPVTGVYPQVLYQPAIQIADPIINDLQTYGGYGGGYGSYGGYGGPYGDDVYGGHGTLDVGIASSGIDGSLMKRQLGSGTVSTGAGGPLGPGPLGVPGGPGSTITNVAGTPNTMSTDTLIQPIVSIQPHAYQPVPVPVSQPYDYPVPVGVSVPLAPAPIFPFDGRGRFDHRHRGFDDGFCDFDDDRDIDDDC
ncbi:hypothetical protein BGZ83_008995 [Gryganskiella cystojenkinii]|nr:hypothetical protein BGZ83_008995 [Gryganskiella cystojenkinii]